MVMAPARDEAPSSRLPSTSVLVERWAAAEPAKASVPPLVSTLIPTSPAGPPPPSVPIVPFRLKTVRRERDGAERAQQRAGAHHGQGGRAQRQRRCRPGASADGAVDDKRLAVDEGEAARRGEVAEFGHHVLAAAQAGRLHAAGQAGGGDRSAALHDGAVAEQRQHRAASQHVALEQDAAVALQHQGAGADAALRAVTHDGVVHRQRTRRVDGDRGEGERAVLAVQRDAARRDADVVPCHGRRCPSPAR